MQDWLVALPRPLDGLRPFATRSRVPAIEVAERENRVCTPEADWTANPACVIFVAVDGFFVRGRAGRQLYATQLYSPQWSGFKFAEIANAAATGGDARSRDLSSTRCSSRPRTATCVAEMQAEMAADPANFPFEGSLADIATARGCAVVTVD